MSKGDVVSTQPVWKMGGGLDLDRQELSIAGKGWVFFKAWERVGNHFSSVG